MYPPPCCDGTWHCHGSVLFQYSYCTCVLWSGLWSPLLHCLDPPLEKAFLIPLYPSHLTPYHPTHSHHLTPHHPLTPSHTTPCHPTLYHYLPHHHTPFHTTPHSPPTRTIPYHTHYTTHITPLTPSHTIPSHTIPSYPSLLVLWIIKLHEICSCLCVYPTATISMRIQLV